jgi:hypothetical protein
MCAMLVRVMTGGAVLAAALALGGCASDNGGADAGHARHSDVMGMTCPKCETTWVGPHAQAGGSKIQALHWGREAVCPDCDAMARAYMKDGQKVLHNCPTCNVTPQPATPVTPMERKGTHI